ncbi:MAG: CXXX repeat peptide maturase [Bacteroidaceae bacterium]|nr:CXXX repeat peptide maturase [Bacteroidaceae bacterium]
MLQYLIILLDEASVQYCHAPSMPTKKKGLIPLETLRRGIVFAMKENLSIQFVYPAHELPAEYVEVIESIDHTKIKPATQAEGADVLVIENWTSALPDAIDGATCIIHASRTELQTHLAKVKELLGRVARLNVVLTDVETFRDEDIDDYSSLLAALSDCLIELFKQGRLVQLNQLTDRLLLTQMNNCGAGDTTVTLAPNGRFYLCPAFYHEDEAQSVGDLATGLDIRNRQLLRLDHAPICRHCDAYHCRRCIWMNGRLTLDANTPSHQQCVVAHLERNASRALSQKMSEAGIRMSDTHEIAEINYLDPFNNYKQWK